MHQGPARRFANRVGALMATSTVLAVAMIAFTGSPAAACSCVGGTDEELFERTDAVFTGRLLDRQDPGMASGHSSADFSTLRFEVAQVFKGDVSVDQAVVTEQSGASCGLEIAGEGPFIVFARSEYWDPEQDVPDGMLYAGLCDGTRTLAAQPVPVSFGVARGAAAPPEGRQPATTAPSLTEDDDAYLYFIGGLVAVAVIVGGSIAFFGRRRKADRAL